MKTQLDRLWLSVVMALMLFSAPVRGNVTNLVCRSISLKDQYGKLQALSFPRTNLVVLTIADERSNADVNAWTLELSQRLQAGIEFVGVANLAGVPFPLRGHVRRKIQRVRTESVMLDWNGTVANQLRSASDTPNIFLLDCNGRVMLHLTGVATTEAIDRLVTAIKSPGKVEDTKP